MEDGGLFWSSIFYKLIWYIPYPGVRGWIPYSFPIYTQVRVWRYDGVSIKSETLGTEVWKSTE